MERFEGDVHLHPYALRRIQERDLSPAEVEEAVRAPEEIVAGGKGRFVAQRETRTPMRGRPALLRVIFEEQAGRRMIVNAYLTTKLGKYRRRQP